MTVYARLLVVGIVLWTGGTLLIRVFGQRVLPVDNAAAIFLLFAVSFAACAWLVRLACRRARLAPADWPAGAIAILLPTLVLDPFSSAFFPAVFPNLPPQAAGVFGGWMLCCCAGGLIGVSLRRGAAA